MDLNKTVNQWGALLLMSFIWGTSFILIKKSLLAYTPLQSGALRISFAFLYFLPIAIKRLKKINRKNIFSLLAVGFIGNFFPAFLFATGETMISSTLASMINSVTPIFVLLIGLIFYKKKVNSYKIAGIFLGFIGAFGLIVRDISSLSGWNYGALLVLLATLMYGINTNVLKYNLQDLDGISVSALSFFFTGPFAISVFLMTDFHSAFASEYFWQSTLSLATLSFFSSFVAVLIFNISIKYMSAVFAASVTYLIPVFALFWGILDNEKITWMQILSIAVVFSGVALVNRRDKSTNEKNV